MTAFPILWSSSRTSTRAATASLALPLVLLGAANTFPNYALLLRYGAAQMIQLKLNTTPNGMFPTSIFFFTALTWISPFLLPALALLAAWILDYYVGFFLDTKTKGSELRRLVAWGLLPLVFQRVLAGTFVLVCGRECDLFNPLASNVAFFLNSKDTEVFTYELAAGFDVFSIWAMVITGRAIAARYERSPVAVTIGVALLFFACVATRVWMVG